MENTSEKQPEAILPESKLPESKLPESKLPVKLIALDLDDTLLDSNRQISDRNVAALRRAAALGIYIVLCSGRAEDGILPFIRRLDLAGTQAGRFLIAINGCSIYDMHLRQQIYVEKVPADVLLHADKTAEEMGLKTEVYTPDTIYCHKLTKWTKIDVEMCYLKGVEVEDYQNFIQKGFPKMLIPGEPEKLQILMKKLKEDFGERAVLFTSKPFFLELLPPNCGKGEAISWLCNHLGLSMENAMCFGDGMNDESMMRKCGFSVCMKNGEPYIKEVAKFVTEYTNDQSGVGHFIEKYVL